MIVNQKRIMNLRRHLPNSNDGDQVVVAVPIEESVLQVLKEMGFSEPPSAGETLLPPANMGKYSRINAEGDYLIRRDLPKETVYIPIEWHWVEWRGGGETEEMSDIRYRPIERFQREFRPPPGIELSIVENAEKELMLATSELTVAFDDDRTLKNTINMFLENFNIAYILDRDLISVVPERLQRLNWTILPEGEYPWQRLREHIEPIVAKASIGRRPVIENRIETIADHEPDFVAIGRAGFSGYIIFGFRETGLYICESAYYGNATYVFNQDWARLSRMTKAEILDQNLHEERLVHVAGWHQRVESLFDV